MTQPMRDAGGRRFGQKMDSEPLMLVGQCSLKEWPAVWMEVVKPSSAGDAKTAAQLVGMTLMEGNVQLLLFEIGNSGAGPKRPAQTAGAPLVGMKAENERVTIEWQYGWRQERPLAVLRNTRIHQPSMSGHCWTGEQ